jgi:hypothetical protein
MLQGQTTAGSVFMRYIQVDPSGMAFSLADPASGVTVVYQRMQ